MENIQRNWVPVCLICLLVALLFLFFYVWSESKTMKESFENEGSKIPKTIIQTSKEKPSATILNNFKLVLSPGWKYKHFDDDEIIEFFKNNYLAEFPDVITRFYSMPTGAHKADLFRYYYIYVKGGVFVDSDAVLEINTDDLVKDYDFFSVLSKVTPNTIFQGLIGAVPNNEIMYKALVDIYNIDIKKLSQHYFLIVQNLHKIVNEKKYDFKIKLYEEIIDKEKAQNKYATTVDPENGKVILKHYFADKKVPAKRDLATKD